MADTAIVALIDSDWTDISGTATSGFFTNEGSNQVIYREAAAKPDAAVTNGHTLQPKGGVSFNLAAGQEVWARSRSEAGRVSRTLN